MFTFVLFAEKLELISQHKSRNKITEMLAQLFKVLSPDESKMAAYLLLGTLAPAYKPVRFNLAEKQLFSFLLSYLDTTSIVGAKDKFSFFYHELGDLGQALFDVTNVAEKSVPRVNSFIEIFSEMESLSQITGIGSIERKKDYLFLLLDRLSSLEQKYLIKIIAGQLRLGFSTLSLLDAFASLYEDEPKKLKTLKVLIEENYNVCADVGILIYNLKTYGTEVLYNPTPKAGIPVCPATAERVSSINELLERQPELVVQRKLDGLRLQVHKDVDGIFLFSRNLLNVSEMFPEIVLAFQDIPMNNFIVDGEILGYNKETSKDVNFQKTSQRRRKHGVEGISGDIPMRIYLFDVLMLEGRTLLHTQYNERRKKLILFADRNPIITVLQERQFVCDLSNPESVQTTKASISKFFYSAIDEGYEGIVAKKTQGLYQTGKRGFNWIKIKHLDDYKLRDTIDAVVIGYLHGKGRRASLGMGAFLIALFNEETQTFQSLAKVGTGVTDKDFVELTEKLYKMRLLEKPHNYEVNSVLIPDVWVEAKVVVEVDADEITISKVHTAAFGKIEEECGLALRFPRMIKIRYDKTVKESTKIEELLRLTNFK